MNLKSIESQHPTNISTQSKLPLDISPFYTHSYGSPDTCFDPVFYFSITYPSVMAAKSASGYDDYYALQRNDDTNANASDNVHMNSVGREHIPDKAVTNIQFKPNKRWDRHRFVILSDTENDINCVIKTLQFVGILNNKNNLNPHIDGINIVHTGDLINKKNPDPNVIDFWCQLRANAAKKGCCVKIVGGNHEQLTWKNIECGDNNGLKKKQTNVLMNFFEGLDLIRVHGDILLIHGYPTYEFAKTLYQFKESTGKNLNWFNEDHFRKAFRSTKAINQYSYSKGKEKHDYLLYDVGEASAYYKKNGRKIATILAELGIRYVVHGHRPQKHGVQKDFEFSKWLPGIRMIDNDNMAKITGIGATIMCEKKDGEMDIIFLNYKNASKKLKTRVVNALFN